MEHNEARQPEGQRFDFSALRAQLSVKRATNAWEVVESLVSSKRPKSYDEAVGLLLELREHAVRNEDEPAFSADLRALRDRHARKRSFLGRLEKAGL
jgi:hypothetical protein